MRQVAATAQHELRTRREQRPEHSYHRVEDRTATGRDDGVVRQQAVADQQPQRLAEPREVAVDAAPRWAGTRMPRGDESFVAADPGQLDGTVTRPYGIDDGSQRRL